MKFWFPLTMFVVLLFVGSIYSALPRSDQESAAADAGKPQLVPLDQPQPVAVVEGSDQYDFGQAVPDTTGTHIFTVRNAGQGILKLFAGETTCTCTISGVQKTELLPGESTDITVDYSLNEENPRFRQVAPIYTNDRNNQRIDLTIFGQVARLVSVDPDYVFIPSVSGDEGGTSDTTVYSPIADNFAITGHEFQDPELGKFLEISYQREESNRLQELRGRSGYRVKIHAKPGLPLGRFRQTIRLLTDIETPKGPAEVTVDVGGKVVGPISIAGGDGAWNDETGILTLGTVKSREGTSRELRLFVHGEHKEINVHKIETYPADVLEVKLGKPTTSRNGKARIIPFTVTVKKGARDVNCLGSVQGSMGRIEFHTDHPRAPDIRMMVMFAVRGE